MNTEQELRPCKACGQPEGGHIAANGGWHWGECWNCDYRTSFHRSVEEAHDEWNRRSSDEQAEVVGWRARRWGSSKWELFAYDPRSLKQFSFFEPVYASPPAVAAGGVTVTDAMVEDALREWLDWPHGQGMFGHPQLVRMRAALSAALAVGDEGILPDLLAEMAKHPGWSIERGYRDRGDDEGGPYGWCVYDVRGGRSDLEWDLIGFGETPHEALSAAVASLPTPPSRGEGE
jgi:hypothetical protein